LEQRDYRIRRASPADAEALAQVHEATWRETYVGLSWVQMLNARTAEERAAGWREVLTGATEHLSTTYVAERPDGRLAAFASCGPQRQADFAEAGYGGEFTAVYVLKTDQRRGLGTRLMKAMMADLRERGLSGFTLWVPRENIPARSLYEQLGAKLLGQREVTRVPGGLIEVAYGWEATA
jgi:ribosomal protein S18 acetylase RimI-like enzyme